MTAPTSNTDSLGNTPSGKLPRSRFAPPPTEPDPFWSPPDTSPLCDERGEVIMPVPANSQAGLQTHVGPIWPVKATS